MKYYFITGLSLVFILESSASFDDTYDDKGDENC